MTTPQAGPPPTNLQHAVHQAIAKGARLEYIDSYMAVTASGRPVNNVAYGVGFFVLLLIVAPILGLIGFFSGSVVGILFGSAVFLSPWVLLVVWLVKVTQGGIRRYRLTLAPNGVVHTEPLGR